MDGGTIGLIGGQAVGLIGAAGAFHGCRASYRAAAGDAERRFLVRGFLLGGVALAAFLSVTLAASLGYFPRWIHWGATALLGPAIVWLNRCLARFPRTPKDAD